MNTNKQNLIILLVIVNTLIVLFVFVMGFSYFVSPHINTLVNGYYLEQNVKDKNLTLPFPNYNLLEKGSFYYAKNLNTIFSQNITEFHKNVQNNYVYNNKYDCKYWAYVWTLYWKNNLRAKDWNLKYMTTKNHIFVMFSKDKEYCVANMHRLDCYKNK